MQEWADSPLTVILVSAATQVGKRLQGVPFHAVYSSTSGLAIEEIATAHPAGHVKIVTHGVAKKCISDHFTGAQFDSL